MKFSSDHIHRLLLEKLTGTIEPEDDLALERLIREEKKVSQQWTDMKEQLEQAEKSGFTMEPDVEKSWRNLSPHLLRPPVKSLSFFQKATMAAALVAALVAAGIALAESFRGDDGPNTIEGTNDSDRIDGLAGDHDLYGLGGADEIFGNRGDDDSFGGNGRDTISAGRDDYVDVQGDGRADELCCGSGRDVVRANPEDHLSDDCEVAKGVARPK